MRAVWPYGDVRSGRGCWRLGPHEHLNAGRLDRGRRREPSAADGSSRYTEFSAFARLKKGPARAGLFASDHLALPQVRDLILVEAELRQHVLGLLAELRRP